MSKETVKPMPATMPPPAIVGQLSARRPSRSRRASVAEARIPSGLPTTYAATMPSVIGDVNARLSSDPFRWMPALARANSGTITKLVQGWSAC